MSRSIEVIQAQIIASIKGDTVLFDPTNIDPSKRGLTSSSQVAIWLEWTYNMAVSINQLEQINDLYQSNIESEISLAAIGTAKWLQNKCINYFQYDATNPQILQIDPVYFAPLYPVVDATKRIITQCAIVTRPQGGFIVKVAKTISGVLTALSSLEQISLNSFLNVISFGVNYTVQSQAADFIMLGYDLYYDGQYSAIMSSATIAAINLYLQTNNVNNFNGIFDLSDFEVMLKKIPGMISVVAKQVEARQTGAYNPATVVKLIDNYKTNLRNYNPYAGYLIADTDSGDGRDLVSVLNFFPQ